MSHLWVGLVPSEKASRSNKVEEEERLVPGKTGRHGTPRDGRANIPKSLLFSNVSGQPCSRLRGYRSQVDIKQKSQISSRTETLDAQRS